MALSKIQVRSGPLLREDIGEDVSNYYPHLSSHGVIYNPELTLLVYFNIFPAKKQREYMGTRRNTWNSNVSAAARVWDFSTRSLLDND